MSRGQSKSQREQQEIFHLLCALGGSLDLRAVLDDAQPILIRLVSADAGALAVSGGARPEDYLWLPALLPSDFLLRYQEMAPYDFIRQAVIAQPGRALFESEMMPRREIERNEMYQLARGMGVLIEQALSVMLHVDNRWESGLSLYRHKRRPFRERDRVLLQRLTPAIANAVRNCRRFGELAAERNIRDALLSRRGVAVVLVNTRGVELGRTDLATALFERWFGRSDLRASGLPPVICEAVAEAALQSPLEQAHLLRRTVTREKVELHIEIFPLQGRPGAPVWVIELEEKPLPTTIQSQVFGRLTPRQREIARKLVESGLSYKQIAAELGIGEGTVRTHVEHIYRTAKVHSRAELWALTDGNVTGMIDTSGSSLKRSK